MHKIIVVALYVISSFAQLPECGGADTSLAGSDTIIQKLYCYDGKEPRMLLPYKNGELHGKQKSWHNDGGIAGIVNYVAGEYHGARLGFNEKGDTTLAEEYDLGKPVGTHREWFPNGRIKAIVHYDSAGQKHGLRQRWREDGTRKDSTVFAHGKYVEERQYFTSGGIRHHTIYQDGVFWESFAWDPEGACLDTILHGTGSGINYSEDGKTRYYREFKDGKEISSRELSE